MVKYLQGIAWDPFEGIPELYVADHHIQGWRYFTTHKKGKAKKTLIFQKLAEGGMLENKGHWDWHHVVEGNHLAPLYTSYDYERFYDDEWPTVLMHSNEEHKVLNSLFRSKGTLEGLQHAGSRPLQGGERMNYLRTLYQRYQDIYQGDPLLQKVAHNVISSIK